MKRILFLVFVLASGSSAALGQGTIFISNTLGAAIYPVLLPGGSQATGPSISVEVFVSDAHDPANKLGPTMTLTDTGLFASDGVQVVPGVLPGAIATLVARAWDNSTGDTYDTARMKGYTFFKSPVLGGDVDGDPSTPPVAAPLMVSGKPNGFVVLVLAPEPNSAALAGLGTLLLFAMTKLPDASDASRDGTSSPYAWTNPERGLGRQ